MTEQSPSRSSLGNIENSKVVCIYSHPEIFNKKGKVKITETSRLFIYSVKGVGHFSLIKLDYGEEQVLQVDLAHINEDQRDRGYSTDFYRFILNNLPKGFTGVLSGTITDDRIHSIYQTLKRDFAVEEFRNNPYQKKPSMYLVRPK